MTPGPGYESRPSLVIFWAIIAVTFLLLALRHLKASRDEVPNFEIEASLGMSSWNGVPTSAGAVREVIDQFNAYIDRYNAASRSQNMLAVKGYLLAALTALTSFVLSAIDLVKGCN